MNENYINNINKRLEILSKRCDSLEQDNNEYKKKIQLNQENIINLQSQLIFLRKENTKKINEIKANLLTKLKYLFQNNQQNKEKGQKNNEIINLNNNDDIINIKYIYEEINKMVQKSLENFKYDIYTFIGTTPKGGEEIINEKGKSLRDKFEYKLYNIFYDQSQNILEKDLNELKKLGTALLIKEKVSPLNYSKFFLDKNMENKDKNEEINEIKRINNAKKKEIILVEMEDILIGKIQSNNEKQFIKEFRRKYGISKEEFSDDEIKKEIKNNNDEIHIIEAILKNLKYLQYLNIIIFINFRLIKLKKNISFFISNIKINLLIK